MTELQRRFIDFIPSDTMKKYLSQSISSGSWTPSAEDMIATVYQSVRNISEKNEFFRILFEQTLAESTRQQLEEIICTNDRAIEYLNNSRYAFECESKNGRVYVFNGIRRAVKFLRKHEQWYIKVIDKQKRGDERYTARLYADNLEIVEAVRLEHNNAVCSSLGDRYVKFPVPFETGDVVYFTGDKNGLFCVVNADLPSEELSGTDFIDSSIMVIPYEYREYATPELVKEHYERCKSPSTYVHDVIAEQHEHMSVIYTELLRKYDKGEEI